MRSNIFIIFITALFLVPAGTKGQAPAGLWPSFRGDQSLTGTTTVNITGRPQYAWTFDAGSGIKSSPVIGNNSIFIGTDDGILYCLDFNGEVIWTFNSENAIEAAPLYYDGSVYFGTLMGELFALDAKTGNLRWKYATEGQISGSANYLVSSRTKSILVGSYDFSLHSINDATGQAEWKYTSDNYINGAPSVYGKVAVFGGCDGNLHVVDTETGNLIQIRIGTYMNLHYTHGKLRSAAI
jgi:outer membrane protein assembly factor BamB